ncbi:MAG TPA: protocatechuate 3,4-dioxygenase subunit alpha [Azospirillum sp.]|nr:protocatechuate 3,4-dioxygenase subunit alpha [Azospirillum sp.]
MPAGTTPSQTVGPFFHKALDRPAWSDLTAGGARGEVIRIEGRVLDGDGVPVTDALLEIWQADAGGRYAHPDDTREGAPDANFPGFGRAATDGTGTYRFTTVRPGPVPGNGNAMQAPHILVSVFARGLLDRLVTRIYFADEPANDTDPVLNAIADPAARRTLLAAREDAGGVVTYRFDIVLQGDGETAFFEF